MFMYKILREFDKRKPNSVSALISFYTQQLRQACTSNIQHTGLSRLNEDLLGFDTTK